MGSRPTLFRHLLNSDLPPSELSDQRLSREAQVLIGSGTITTAGTMGFIVYHIMSNPAIKERLQAELKDVMAGYPQQRPTWAQLEKLPYYQAVLKESFRFVFQPISVFENPLTLRRLSFGTMHRRPRVSPKQDLRFKDWVIPAGVPVGMSAYFQHRDSQIFPRPMEFLPERWLEDVTPAMNYNYIPFSRGSRYCLGMK